MEEGEFGLILSDTPREAAWRLVRDVKARVGGIMESGAREDAFAYEVRTYPFPDVSIGEPSALRRGWESEHSDVEDAGAAPTEKHNETKNT